MTEIPNPEKLIDITGPEGETLFWSAKAWLVAGSEGQIQARLDEMWVHYSDVTDDRLLALVGALCVEASVDALLEAAAPGFAQCREDQDVTFSLKIKVARSLQLLPARILTGCDLVRQMRNEFAHHLDVKEFGQLDGKYLGKLGPYVAEFNRASRDASNHRQLFTDFVGFTLFALDVYTRQVARLREYLETTSFREAFKQWAGSPS